MWKQHANYAVNQLSKGYIYFSGRGEAGQLFYKTGFCFPASSGRTRLVLNFPAVYYLLRNFLCKCLGPSKIIVFTYISSGIVFVEIWISGRRQRQDWRSIESQLSGIQVLDKETSEVRQHPSHWKNRCCYYKAH